MNPRLFDVGMMDDILELKAPTKEKRYELLKFYLANDLGVKV